jgi:hypothetical protein
VKRTAAGQQSRRRRLQKGGHGVTASVMPKSRSNNEALAYIPFAPTLLSSLR